MTVLPEAKEGFFSFFIDEYKNQVFIYGLPAGGDSLTSQSLARRKCLLMGPSLSLYRSVLSYYCIFFSLNLAKKTSSLSFFLLLFLTIFPLHRIFNSAPALPSSWILFKFLLAVVFQPKYCWHVSTTDRDSTRMTSWFFKIVFPL